jgi:hypothetical protein
MAMTSTAVEPSASASATAEGDEVPAPAPCPHCRQAGPADAVVCANCHRHRAPRWLLHRLLVALVVLMCLGGALFALAGGRDHVGDDRRAHDAGSGMCREMPDMKGC